MMLKLKSEISRIILFGTPPVPKARGVLWGCFCVAPPDYVKFDKIAGTPGDGGYAASRMPIEINQIRKNGCRSSPTSGRSSLQHGSLGLRGIFDFN